jgi:rubrerythrin
MIRMENKIGCVRYDGFETRVDIHRGKENNGLTIAELDELLSVLKDARERRRVVEEQGSVPTNLLDLANATAERRSPTPGCATPNINGKPCACCQAWSDPRPSSLGVLSAVQIAEIRRKGPDFPADGGNGIYGDNARELLDSHEALRVLASSRVIPGAELSKYRDVARILALKAAVATESMSGDEALQRATAILNAEYRRVGLPLWPTDAKSKPLVPTSSVSVPLIDHMLALLRAADRLVCKLTPKAAEEVGVAAELDVLCTVIRAERADRFAQSTKFRCTDCGCLWRLNPPTEVQPKGSWSLWDAAQFAVMKKCCDNSSDFESIIVPVSVETPETSKLTVEQLESFGKGDGWPLLWQSRWMAREVLRLSTGRPDTASFAEVWSREIHRAIWFIRGQRCPFCDRRSGDCNCERPKVVEMSILKRLSNEHVVHAEPTDEERAAALLGPSTPCTECGEPLSTSRWADPHTIEDCHSNLKFQVEAYREAEHQRLVASCRIRKEGDTWFAYACGQCGVVLDVRLGDPERDPPAIPCPACPAGSMRFDARWPADANGYGGRSSTPADINALREVLAKAVHNGGNLHAGHEPMCPVAPGTKMVEGTVIEGLSKDPNTCNCWVRDARKLLETS